MLTHANSHRRSSGAGDMQGMVSRIAPSRTPSCRGTTDAWGERAAVADSCPASARTTDRRPEEEGVWEFESPSRELASSSCGRETSVARTAVAKWRKGVELAAWCVTTGGLLCCRARPVPRSML